MKKTVLSLMAALCAGLYVSAQTNVTMTLNVDHSDRIKVRYLDLNYNEVFVQNLQDGENLLTIPVGSYPNSVDVIAEEGYGLSSCTYLNPGETEATACEILYMTSTYFDAAADPSTEGAIWTVNTFDFEESRMAEAAFSVDDASKVKVTRKASNTVVDLTNGQNNVKFIPAEGDNAGESVFSIESTEWGRPLYEVLINGKAAEGYDSGNHYVTLNNGDEVAIYATYPDIEIPVRFTYTEGAYGFVTRVAADGKDVEFDGYTANVKCGSEVEFWYDNDTYSINSISIDGEVVSYPWSPISLGIVTEEVNVAIDAVKNVPYKINVNVNDASYVKLLAFEEGSSIYYGGTEIMLSSGENKDVEIPGKRHFFSIEAKTRSKLVALSLNGQSIEQQEKTDYYGETYLEWPFPIELNEGDVLDIIGEGPVRDKSAIVYVDRIPEGRYQFDFNLNGYKPELSSGYSFITFDDNPDAEIGDLPFNIRLYYSPMTSWAYLNGEAVEPVSATDISADYELPEVVDGSVIKIFTVEEPETYAVSMKFSDVEPDNVAVRKDYLATVQNPENGFDVLGPTTVSIAPDENILVTVSVDGDVVNPGENGIYDVFVESATEITVERNPVGIVNVTDESFDVITMQGIMIMRKASAADLKSLPAGIYIVNGKKVFIN